MVADHLPTAPSVPGSVKYFIRNVSNFKDVRSNIIAVLFLHYFQILFNFVLHGFCYCPLLPPLESAIWGPFCCPWGIYQILTTTPLVLKILRLSTLWNALPYNLKFRAGALAFHLIDQFVRLLVAGAMGVARIFSGRKHFFKKFSKIFKKYPKKF